MPKMMFTSRRKRSNTQNLLLKENNEEKILKIMIEKIYLQTNSFRYLWKNHLK